MLGRPDGVRAVVDALAHRTAQVVTLVREGDLAVLPLLWEAADDVVIVDAVRTPIGKRNGGLSTLHPAETLARVQRAVPDIGHVAWKQSPGLAPVCAVVIQHLAGALGLCCSGLIAPGWIVFHTVGRIADEQ